MKIRLTGTREECEKAYELMTCCSEVLSRSSWHPWLRDDPSSKIGAVYLEVRL